MVNNVVYKLLSLSRSSIYWLLNMTLRFLLTILRPPVSVKELSIEVIAKLNNRTEFLA
jgi:hypothetical protein